MERLRKGFLTAEQGATAIEYAMLAATLSVPVLLVFSYLADDVLAVLGTTSWAIACRSWPTTSPCPSRTGAARPRAVGATTLRRRTGIPGFLI